MKKNNCLQQGIGVMAAERLRLNNCAKLNICNSIEL